MIGDTEIEIETLQNFINCLRRDTAINIDLYDCLFKRLDLILDTYRKEVCYIMEHKND